MVYIRKRNGSLEPFDRSKIISAIIKAFLEVDEVLYEMDTPTDIANEISDFCKNSHRRISVEEIQDLIEEKLMESERKDVARAFIRYRYKRELVRETNETYTGILELVELNNEEVLEENSNKNAIVASTQRDYIAGEVSRDLSKKLLLPSAVVKADKDG